MHSSQLLYSYLVIPFKIFYLSFYFCKFYIYFVTLKEKSAIVYLFLLLINGFEHIFTAKEKEKIGRYYKYWLRPARENKARQAIENFA